MKNKKCIVLNIVVVVLLLFNAIFLANIWKSREFTHDNAIIDRILHATAIELQILMQGLHSTLLESSESNYSAYIFVQEGGCSVCLSDAKTYWAAMLNKPEIEVIFYHYSTRSRDWERFANWMGFPLENIIPLKDISSYDPVLWESSGQSIVIINNITGNVELVHAAFSELRGRSLMFYEAILERYN